MSTRSQIRIKGNEPVLVYRHSDGYPGNIEREECGVVPDVMPFCLTFIKERGWDPEYLTACLVVYLKQWHCGGPAIPEPDLDENGVDRNASYSNWCTMEVNGIKMRTIGLGIDCGIHGDIEYLYDIDEKGITVTKIGWQTADRVVEKLLFEDYEMVNGKCLRRKKKEKEKA